MDKEYEDYQKASNDHDMLMCCVNRLLISDDKEELPKLYKGARYHLACIYSYGLERLAKKFLEGGEDEVHSCQIGPASGQHDDQGVEPDL